MEYKRDALNVFDTMGCTLEFLLCYLKRYLTYAELGAQAALADTQAHVFNDANFTNVWNRLLPADRQVLKLLASGVQDLQSGPTRALLGR